MATTATSGTKIKSRKKKGKIRRKHTRVLERINFSAGIDAGAEEHYVTLPEEAAEPSVRKFSTTTRGLYELADWLASAKVDTVAVEATGVYCVPLLEVLEARGFQVLLAKPSSLKSVNDRQKSDMMDCQWIQLLHTFGLLRAQLGPQEAINAAAHKLATMIYLTLKHQRPYVDPGPDHYVQRHQDRIVRSMERRARQLGYTLVKAA